MKAFGKALLLDTKRTVTAGAIRRALEEKAWVAVRNRSGYPGWFTDTAHARQTLAATLQGHP